MHVRVNLATMKDMVRAQLPRASDMGRLVALRGTVIRVTTAKMREAQREFMCTKCKHIFTVAAAFELYYTIPLPTK